MTAFNSRSARAMASSRCLSSGSSIGSLLQNCRFIVSVRASTEWKTKESAGGPDRGRQFCDVMDGECRQTRQDAGQVVTNRDFEAAAAFNYGQNSGHLRASLGAA